jgi:alpha-beta hydrolase superfamily lysophospholipase
MRSRVGLCLILATVVVSAVLRAQVPAVGKNTVMIRGRAQDVYFFPAQGARQQPYPKVLFAPGDGGWRGLAIKIAQTIASWGYDVYGLDTKHYLESFTAESTLTVPDVMNDFRTMTKWMTKDTEERVNLVGWSEGAGLCLLAAAAGENKKIFTGLLDFSLTESNVLAWRWSDYLTYITHRDSGEPGFGSVGFLPAVAPLPVMLIQSTGDEYVSVEASKRLYSAAREPKKLVLINAQNHRFTGNRDELLRNLREGLQWIRQTTP